MKEKESFRTLGPLTHNKQGRFSILAVYRSCVLTGLSSLKGVVLQHLALVGMLVDSSDDH